MEEYSHIQDECGLEGVIDMHLHAEPDSPKAWWASDKADMLNHCLGAGYRAVLFIGNDWPTHREAWLLSRRIKGIRAFGGLTFSFCHGSRINLGAVERCLSDSASSSFRCVWLPTTDADFDRQAKGCRGIPVLDEHGNVLPEVLDLMALCRDAGIMLGTGHAGPDGATALAKAAKRVHLETLVITQSMLSPRGLSSTQLQYCLDQGAYLEHVLLAAFKGEGHSLISAHRKHAYVSIADMAHIIRLAPEKQFLGTDLNQILAPHPVGAMRLFLRNLKEAGLSREDILCVSRRVPARLLRL